MEVVRRYLPQFCLVLVGCCIAFFLTEGFVRLFYPHSRDHVIPGGLFDIDDYLGWKLKAKKSATHHTRYFKVVYSTNALGYRDKSRNLLKRSDTYRVLLYGDSQVFGWGISENQRFSNLIEDQKQSLEVWNLAVPGYGFDQEILSYERGGQSLNADEVIFFVSQSTLKRTYYDHIYNKPKPKFITDQRGSLKIVPVPPNAHMWTNLLYSILHPLYLPYFVERRLAVLKGLPDESRNPQAQKAGIEDIPIGELQRGMLDRASAVALERKHRMTILVFLPKTLTRALQNSCDQKGIGLLEIDLHGEDHDLILGKHDSHWNSQAHQQIARQLISFLKIRGNQ